MPQNTIKFLFLFLFLFAVTACGTGKKAVEENNTVLSKIKDEVLINRLDSLSKQVPDFFYSKFDSRYEDNNSKVSFKTSIRMRVDSATQAIMSYARIPIYNAMLTPDTLTLIDKREKCYINERVDYLKKAFNVNFNYKNVQELILGLPIAWDESIDYYQMDDSFNYIISTPKKERVRTLGSKENDLSIQYYFRNNGQSIEKTIIESPKDSTTITVRYIDRQKIGDYNLPTEEKIHVATPKNDIYLDLKYSKTTVNDPRVLYLSIPSKYESCE